MSSRTAVAPALLLAIALSGCALLRHHRGYTRPQPVTVHVDNHNFNDATVYAYTRGSTFRLGSVGGKGTGSFTLPSPIYNVAFIIHLLASDNFQTVTIAVAPGDHLELVITADLAGTYIIR